MKFLLRLLLICLLPLSLMARDANATYKAKINTYERQLATINRTLTKKDDLSLKQLNALKVETTRLIQQIQAYALDLQDLKDAAVSDDDEKHFSGFLTQTKKLYDKAQSSLGQIQESIFYFHAKNLVRRSPPLWLPEVFTAAVTKAAEETLILCQKTTTLTLDFIKNIDTIKELVSAIVYLIAFIIVFFPLRIFIRKKWGPRKGHFELPLQTKLRAFISSSIGAGLLPALIIFCLYYLLVPVSSAMTVVEKHFFFAVLIAISGFILIARVIVSLFSNKYPSYRIFDYAPETTQRYSRSLTAMLAIITLNFLYDYCRELFELPVELTQLTLFVLFVLLFFNTVHLVRTFAGYSFVRFLAHVFTFILPLLTLVGYISLATYLFVSALYSVLVITIFKGLFTIISKAVTQIFHIDRPIFEKISLSDRGGQFVEYWTKAFFAVVFFFLSIALLLISWGVSKAAIVDWSNKVLFGFEISGYNFSLIKLIFAIVTFVILFSATKFIQSFLDARVFKYTTMDKGLAHAVKTSIGYLGMAISFFLSIRVLGFELASLGYILGGLSVGVGLGLQPIVTNFISGLIMLIERPVQIGDIIDVGSEGGIVTRISVRATEVRTWERASLLVPNSHFMTNSVKNWTHENPIKRYAIAVGVAYGSDVELVRDTLLEVVKEFYNVAKKPEPYVLFKEFGESTLEFELRFYVQDYNLGGITVASKVRYEINRLFKERGIVIAFPQRDIYIKEYSDLH